MTGMTQTFVPTIQIAKPTGQPRRNSGSYTSILPKLSLIIFALLSTLMAVRSDGAWLDDDLCHYEFARAAWQHPRVLLNSWGRPGCTIPYAMVANIGTMADGFRAARLLTTAMAVLTIYLAWQTARKIRVPHAHLVPLIMLLMPEFFGESFTPCTEIPSALYAIAGAYFLACGRHRLAAVCLAILPATRHELAPFLIPVGLWFLWRRDLVAALLLGWFEATWAAIYWHISERQPILRYFTAQDSTLYGSGNFYHYLLNWLKMAGIIAVILCLAGAYAIVLHESYAAKSRRWNRPGATGRRARMRLLVVGWTIGLVVLETILYAFNRFASGGYSTFLVPAAPFMALCACYGISVFSWRLNPKWMIVCMAIAVGQLGFYLRPYRLTPHQKLLATTISQLHRDHPGCHIVGDSIWISYFDEISPGAREQPPLVTWSVGQVSQLYYLYDNISGTTSTWIQIRSVPNEIVRTVNLSSSDTRPDLFIFRRLPGAK
jgi:hypothetical protein